MNMSFRKVWRDLWRNKGRTLMVIMSISVGVMAVGMVVSANTLTIQVCRAGVRGGIGD